jgi:hypothetical protein
VTTLGVGITAVLLVVGLVLVALGYGNNGSDGGTPPGPGATSDTTDQSVCSIARDIAGSFDVTDTFEQSRQRVADLYNGYGQAASPALQTALRDWVSGMTTGDLTQAAHGLSRVNSVCTSEGY